MFTRKRRLTVAAATTAVLVAGLAGCGSTIAPGTGRTATPPAPATASPTTSPAPATTSPAPAVSSPAAPPRASAAEQLTGFFAAARLADARLRHAAVLVNGGIGTTSMRFSPAALAAVNALDMAPVAHAIPAGLPAELLRRVLLAYSDLESRTMSLVRVSESAYYPGPLPMSGQEGSYIYGCLRNGAPAAARFGGDLASARALAEVTQPMMLAQPDSRAAAELALRIAFIDGANSGCMSCGGAVFTTLTPVIWHPAYVPGAGRSDGTIGGVRFTARYHAARGWQVEIWAC